MLPNLSLVMEFLGSVSNNFIFEILLSHEALVTGRVTAVVTKLGVNYPSGVICDSSWGNAEPKPQYLFCIMSRATKSQ